MRPPIIFYLRSLREVCWRFGALCRLQIYSTRLQFNRHLWTFRNKQFITKMEASLYQTTRHHIPEAIAERTYNLTQDSPCPYRSNQQVWVAATLGFNGRIMRIHVYITHYTRNRRFKATYIQPISPHRAVTTSSSKRKLKATLTLHAKSPPSKRSKWPITTYKAF
jgi:hypothetical protein